MISIRGIKDLELMRRLQVNLNDPRCYKKAYPKQELAYCIKAEGTVILPADTHNPITNNIKTTTDFRPYIIAYSDNTFDAIDFDTLISYTFADNTQITGQAIKAKKSWFQIKTKPVNKYTWVQYIPFDVKLSNTQNGIILDVISDSGCFII